MSSNQRGFLSAAALTLGAISLSAQMGDQSDRAGAAVQKPPPPEWNLPAPALTPEEALKSFRLPPGFRIEVVASEPLINDPVALDFDADGRLWVVEMRSYMPDADGRGEHAPINRVVVLEDTDKNGRMDKSTVYMDGLGLVRTVKVLQHGVLVGEPPNLWFTRDTDGDGRADEKTSLAKDFSVPEMNPEGGPNALLWGLDNWIVGSGYERRLRWQNGKWLHSPVANRGQWGQGMDDYGRMFTNSNSDYLRVDLIPNFYPARNPNLIMTNPRDGAPGSGVNYQADLNQEVWPVRPTAGVNRGYQPGQLRADGTLRRFTATCGPTVYRGDNFPAEFYGNYFAAEPAAHVIRRSILTETEGVLRGRNAYEEKEFLSSTDERFRPVNLYTAPDGTLYVVDLYRGILQHRQFMTTYLRRQIEGRGLDKPVGLGRIYRIVHESRKPGPQPVLSRATPSQLVESLSHPNGWWRITAQRLLVERGDKSVDGDLRKLALESTRGESVRLHALWTLEGLGTLDRATLARVMEDPSPKLRAAAIRLSEPALADGNAVVFESVAKHARDPSREVRLQVALSLGQTSLPARESVLAELLRHHSESPFLVPAVVSGLAGRELAFLERLTADPEWREPRPGFASVFGTLAGAAVRGGEVETLNRLFHRIRMDEEPKWQRVALLNGIRASGVRRITALPSELEAASKAADPEIRTGAEELLTRFVWPEKFGAGPAPLTAAETQLFEKGRTAYESICASCHQLNGRGLAGVAAPLVDSPWVLGSDRILARIVLKGKIGASPAAMPPMEMLPDETLASALTYIRRSWGHEAPPVPVSTVGQMRRAVIVRGRPYTEQELKELAAVEQPDPNAADRR
jgi:glucose/arabinose dehydrogenase/mono/diheme cytochrome c family protein